MSPTVSVVIPTFNHERFVSDAIDSALSQTYPNTEVIVVDDGSTDNTRSRLLSYNTRIRYHYQPNAGLSAARNTGISLAHGEFVAFLDSDDMFHPRKIELQMRWLQGDPTITLCATECIGGSKPEWLPIEDNAICATEISLSDLVVRSRFGSCAVIVRKKCFDRVGVFDTSLRSAEDRDMWIRIASQFRIVRLSAPLWWYRPSPGSMSTNAEKMERFETIVLNRALAMPSLRSRWLFRRKVLGLALLAAARRYQGSKSFSTAIMRLCRSVMTWPLPYSQNEDVVPFARGRLLLALVREAITGGREWHPE